MASKTLRAHRYTYGLKIPDLPGIIETRLTTWDLPTTLQFYNWLNSVRPNPADLALLGCNDRFFLLTALMKRRDIIHPWLFARCREVEAAPDGYLDLWARGHYKSTFITFAGTIQDTLVDPEMTTGIFSYTARTSRKFLKQIMHELERNQDIKAIYPDVLWYDPAKQAPRWSVNEGIVVKRISNPKEGTVEAWGLVEGQPTSVHFKTLTFDDMIERRNVTNPEQIQKATEAWELSDNLGVGENTIRRYIGTRYLLGDTYQVMLDRKVVKPRIYPATHNGKLNGRPVFLSQQEWDRKKISQKSTIHAQMLQNPAGGKQSMFTESSFRPYETRPATVNVYIMADPSRGRTARSDRTAISVIGIDTAGNKYLLDGMRHRMKLSERWEALKMLHDKWRDAPGVQMVKVGYERYGQQSDDEYFQEKMRALKNTNDAFVIEELAWPHEGSNSKEDRVQRLQPDMDGGKFFLPAIIKHPDLGECYWRYNDKTEQIEYWPVQGPTRLMKAMEWHGQAHRNAKAITRLDEEKTIYDLTLAFMEEARLFPFGAKDDFIDATSRVYDMEPNPPMPIGSLVPELQPTYPDA